jgi:hypothetical protein
VWPEASAAGSGSQPPLSDPDGPRVRGRVAHRELTNHGIVRPGMTRSRPGISCTVGWPKGH